MGTRGKQGQQQQQGPVLILKVSPENRSRNPLEPPSSSTNRTKTLYTTTAAGLFVPLVTEDSSLFLWLDVWAAVVLLQNECGTNQSHTAIKKRWKIK